MLRPSTTSIFVGRQQIYDRNLEVFGYELLFRSNAENRAVIADEDVATSQVLVNSLFDIGLELLVGSRLAFVNLTRNFLIGKFALPLQPQQLVIEVLESVEPDTAVVEALRKFRENGFTIALDDYVESDNRQSLIELSDIIKIDLLSFDPKSLERQVRELRRFPVRLLAEKVETVDVFEHCKLLGFDYFQGYFLSRPQIVEGKKITGNQVAMLSLLTKLRDPNVTFFDVVELIKQDVDLTVKILRHVNSMAHGSRRTIDSVRQAAIRLGTQKLLQIVSTIVTAGLGNAPKPVIETSLIRARMCEVLGESLGPDISDTCFIVGLFSTLDSLMGRPLEEVLDQLTIGTEIREAVLNRQGTMGRLLTTVIAFEQGEWDRVRDLQTEGFDFQSAYLKAVAWEQSEMNAAE